MFLDLIQVIETKMCLTLKKKTLIQKNLINFTKYYFTKMTAKINFWNAGEQFVFKIGPKLQFRLI